MTRQRGSSYLLCYQAQYKIDDSDCVPSFPSVLHFSSAHSCVISIKRHIQSPTEVCNVPLREQSIRGKWIYTRHWALIGQTSKEQAGRFCNHCFLLKHFRSAMSHCINEVSTEHGLWKPGRFRGTLPVRSFLECTDQMMQRSDPSFLYLRKGLIPCLRRAFFLLAEQGLFLCGTGKFLLPVDHSKQEEWSWSFLVQVTQDFKPIFSIICSYTVHAIAAIRVRLRARGTPPLKKPANPKSCNRR